MTPAPPIIAAQALTKHYGDFTAVAGIDFEVQKGECFGVLGPNGAGKTTTVRMIQAVSPLTSGTLTVLGHDVTRHGPRIRARSGACHQDNNLDPDFSVLENLITYSRYFDITGRVARERADELLGFMGLAERAGSRIDELSGGMKRRLMLARALVNNPELLILDEPTTGLDPQARHQVWRRVRRLRDEGVTILLTTHYMEEAARLCDRLVIVENGKILVEGSPAELVAEHVGPTVVEVVGGTGVAQLIDDFGWDAEHAGDRMLIYGASGEAVYREVMDACKPDDCTLRMANLEDVFLRLTGHELVE
jgi:lipooligosaccharide transport system ATP-binding protein